MLWFSWTGTVSILSGSVGYDINQEQWPVAIYDDSVLDFSEWGLGTYKSTSKGVP